MRLSYDLDLDKLRDCSNEQLNEGVHRAEKHRELLVKWIFVSLFVIPSVLTFVLFNTNETVQLATLAFSLIIFCGICFGCLERSVRASCYKQEIRRRANGWCKWNS